MDPKFVKEVLKNQATIPKEKTYTKKDVFEDDGVLRDGVAAVLKNSSEQGHRAVVTVLVVHRDANDQVCRVEEIDLNTDEQGRLRKVADDQYETWTYDWELPESGIDASNALDTITLHKTTNIVTIEPCKSRLDRPKKASSGSMRKVIDKMIGHTGIPARWLGPEFKQSNLKFEELVGDMRALVYTGTDIPKLGAAYSLLNTVTLEMNTISKSQSTSPSSMRVNISSSDESTSPPWHAWELEAPASADEPWRQDQPDSGTPFSPLVDNSMSDAPEPEGAILNFAGTSELAQIYKEYNSHGYEQLAQFVLLVEALPSEQYVFQMYGLEGLNLLDKLITALQNPEFLYDLGVIRIVATEDSIEVLYQEEIPWVHSMMMWFCSAFRAPIPGAISLSAGTYDV
ncbi:hypothetical protein OAory_01037150 [Aspergillus oryzae]|uniref:Uncharacterized protein n=1 Tax=Aspergillus oryzae TaxID=5062 RepID=A0A1S9E1G6_ASPOZ|nr:hypothetical protein OAory_01037150 [Aspergillus oryzae]